MKLNKLEGDALSFSLKIIKKRQEDSIISSMEKANDAFMKRVSELLFYKRVAVSHVPNLEFEAKDSCSQRYL